jgi:GNAT superfamily N-acetyltransferase
VLRTAEDADAAAVVAILRETDPSIVMTPGDWLARAGRHPERAQYRTIVAERDGSVVGVAQAWLDWRTTLPGACIAIVCVAERARRLGVGSELWHAAQEHLRSAGGTRVRSYVAWTEEAERWSRRRGFEPARYDTVLEIDPRATAQVPDVAGSRAVSLAEVADRPEQIFAVEAEADEPSTVPLRHDYADWLGSVWQPTDRDAGTAVLAGDRVVAICFARFDRAARSGVHGLVAVLPEYRNRGLAALAKTRTLRVAAELGIERMTTSNAETNAAMLAVNRRLGYRAVGRRVELTRQI